MPDALAVRAESDRPPSFVPAGPERRLPTAAWLGGRTITFTGKRRQPTIAPPTTDCRRLCSRCAGAVVAVWRAVAASRRRPQRVTEAMLTMTKFHIAALQKAYVGDGGPIMPPRAVRFVPAGPHDSFSFTRRAEREPFR